MKLLENETKTLSTISRQTSLDHDGIFRFETVPSKQVSASKGDSGATGSIWLLLCLSHAILIYPEVASQ